MKHLLDIPEHDPRAFQPSAGRMRLYGGKSEAPAAPDYVGQANAQAAGNLNAARAQTQANRIDQVTPYGSLVYHQGDGFDQAGYDAALKRYQDQERGLQLNPQVRKYMEATGAILKAPDRNDYMINPDKWSSEIQLSDTGRQLLDAYNRTSLGMADLQGSAMDRVRDSMAQPFDTSGLIDINSMTGMDGWDRAANLIKQRNRESLDQQQAALDTKLANMGLTVGSEGWATQQSQFGKQRNDADIAAELAGSQLQNQMFQQALAGNAATLQQRAYLRNLPLQELSALRNGSQVTNPTFNTPGQQGQTSGPDLLGATQGQYNSQLGQVNAQNAQEAANTQAAAGLAASALYAYGSSAASSAAAGAGASFFF
jgi:hypothetical protein